MVGDDKPVRRNERRAATAQRDDGTHRIAGEVRETIRVNLQPRLLQLRRQRRNLLRHPHPLGTKHRARRGQRQDSNQEFLHTFSFSCSLGSIRTRRDVSRSVSFDSISPKVIPAVDGSNELDDAIANMEKTADEDDLRPH
jgi:hypothetical protein